MTVLRVALQHTQKVLEDAGIVSAAANARMIWAQVRSGSGPGDPEKLAYDLATNVSVSATEMQQSEIYAAQVAAGEPVQYVLGWANFAGFNVRVGPGVLIPRPETEGLVELAQKYAPEAQTFIDLGTGSGAIAGAIALRYPQAQITAVEVSPEAAEWAQKNLHSFSDQVQFLLADVTADLQAVLARHRFPAQYDVVVANPPYIPQKNSGIDPQVQAYEPALALDGGSSDGLEIPLQWVRAAAGLLRPGGLLLLEHDSSQGINLPAAVKELGGWGIVHDRPDLTGKDRYLIARRVPDAPPLSTIIPPQVRANRPQKTRETARVLILDENEHILLVHDSDPGATPTPQWWMTPGGGIDPGETAQQAACREVFEETGQKVSPTELIGPITVRSVRTGHTDRILNKTETFFAWRTTRFTPRASGHTRSEQMAIIGWQWWSTQAVQTALAQQKTSVNAIEVWPAFLPELLALVSEYEADPEKPPQVFAHAHENSAPQDPPSTYPYQEETPVGTDVQAAGLEAE